MKKIIISSIFCGLFLTGCIDNSAIQKLNESAGKYLQQSEPSKAVCRLESSLELDPNIYETRYNLGVAYIELKDYKNAISNLDEALKLKNDSPNAYYTLGVAHEGLGYEILNKNSHDDFAEGEADDFYQKLSDDEISEGVQALNQAINSYKTYLEKNPSADDKENVENQISSIENTIKKYQKEEE